MKTTCLNKVILFFTAAFGLSIVLFGCGSGGESASAPVAELSHVADFNFDGDTYGLQFPNYIYTSENSLGLVFRAEIVSSDQLMWFDSNVLRIDCPTGVTPGTYPLAEVDSVCTLTIFNGFSSTRIETVGGSLVIDETGDWYTGSFDVLFVDNDAPDSMLQWSAGSFSAQVGYAGPPATAFPPVPEGAAAIFAENCQECHSLPALARAGCILPNVIGVDLQHTDILLSLDELYALKVLLNATPAVDDVMVSK